MPAPAEQAVSTPDPVRQIQETLGVSQEEALDLSTVATPCPVHPELDGSFADVLSHEDPKVRAIGQKILEQAGTIRESSQESEPLTGEKALEQALSWAAVKDPETGRLARVTADSRPQPVVAVTESKKK